MKLKFNNGTSNVSNTFLFCELLHTNFFRSLAFHIKMIQVTNYKSVPCSLVVRCEILRVRTCMAWLRNDEVYTAYLEVRLSNLNEVIFPMVITVLIPPLLTLLIYLGSH